MAEAVAIALETEAEAAAEAVLITAAAAVGAAEKVAEAAARAREVRAFAASEAARLVASDAARTASQMQSRADALGTNVAHAASEAATVHETALAAALVASAVAAAAAQVARTVSALDIQCETEVADAAAALKKVTADRAHHVAAETRWRAAGAAIAAKQAAVAMAAPTPGLDQPREARGSPPDRTAGCSPATTAPLWLRRSCCGEDRLALRFAKNRPVARSSSGADARWMDVAAPWAGDFMRRPQDRDEPPLHAGGVCGTERGVHHTRMQGVGRDPGGPHRLASS